MIARLELPDDVLEAVAQRAATIVLERLGGSTTSEFVTVEEACEIARCDRQRIYDLVSSGRLARFKDGSRLLLSRAELVAYLLPRSSRNGSGRGVAA